MIHPNVPDFDANETPSYGSKQFPIQMVDHASHRCQYPCLFPVTPAQCPQNPANDVSAVSMAHSVLATLDGLLGRLVGLGHRAQLLTATLTSFPVKGETAW